MDKLNSELKQDILFALSKEPAHNLALLARQLECSRPALSRSIHQMYKDGLVRQNERSWYLTEIGQKEAGNGKDQLVIYDQQIQPLLTKIMRIAKRHDIAFLTVFAVNDWLCTEKHNLRAYSELSCAYGEISGWQEDDLN